METSGIFQQPNRTFIKTFFHVSLRITKAEMLHTIAEKLILPCAKNINCILSRKEAESKLNILSLSVDAVQRRISLMSKHIKDQVIDQMKSSGPFALQLDKSTYVLFWTQVTAFVSYIYNGEFKHEFLCIINLPFRTCEEDIYQTIDTISKATANR